MPGFVQGRAVESLSSSLTYTATFASNPTAGNTLCGLFSASSGTLTLTPSGVSDNVNGAWTMPSSTTGTICGAVAYITNVAGGATTITFTLSTNAATNFTCIIFEVNGYPTFDTGASVCSNIFPGTTSLATSNVTFTGLDYIFGATISYNGQTATAGSGYNIRVSNPGSFNEYAEDQILTGATSIPITFTVSAASQHYITGGLGFLPAGPSDTLSAQIIM